MPQKRSYLLYPILSSTLTRSHTHNNFLKCLSNALVQKNKRRHLAREKDKKEGVCVTAPASSNHHG